MTSPARKPAARKAAAKSSAAPALKATPAQPATPASAAQRSGNPALRAAAQIIAAQKMLLQAGLRVEREPAPPDLPPPASMEEVFDRRVASALQRLGMPDAADLARLAERLEAMDRKLEAMQRPSRRKAAV